MPIRAELRVTARGLKLLGKLSAGPTRARAVAQTASSASPGGSGSELQHRSGASSFGGATGTHWDVATGRLSIGAGTSPAMTAPSAPSAGKGRAWFEDNGSGPARRCRASAISCQSVC